MFSMLKSKPALQQLVYFPLRGRAELIRMILFRMNEPYEQQTLNFPLQKPVEPFGKVPVWREFDANGNLKLELGQSQSIARHLARRARLMGSNANEQALIESIQDEWTEVRDHLVRVFFAQEENVKSELVQELKLRLGRVNSTHQKYIKTGFYVGGKLSLADLAAFDVMDQLKRVDENLYQLLPALDVVYSGVKREFQPYLSSKQYLNDAPI